MAKTQIQLYSIYEQQNQLLMIKLQPTPLAEWYTLVNEAQFKIHLELGESLESYLVYLLMRFTEKPEIAKAVLAYDFLEALNMEHHKADSLQLVGDKCLILTGLFPERAQKRGLSQDYFKQLGQSAYFTAYQTEFQDELFKELAHEFESMVKVMDAMAA